MTKKPTTVGVNGICPPINPHGLSVATVSTVLACSKAAASMLINNKYDRPSSDLPHRFAALRQLMGQREAVDYDRICLDCTINDCNGCRISQLVEGDD